MSQRKRVVLLGLVIGLAAALCGALPAQAVVRTVNPGESIQDAIDASDPGDKVVLAPGTHRESLQITTNGITLKGPGAKLLPPAHPAETICNSFGAIFGLCIFGEIDFDTFEVIDPVDDVRVSGLKIKGFDGDAILAFGTNDLRVDHAKLVENGGYGAFSLGGTGTRLVANLAKDNGDAGLYVGDSQHAHALVLDNRSTGNLGAGILLRSASLGTVARNFLSGNCVGIQVLGNAPGPATDWLLTGNDASENNNACPPEEEGEPGFSGIGILLLDAEDNEVRGNTASHNHPSGPTFGSGGIGVVGGNENLIHGNRAFANDPFDLVWDEAGSATFSANKCQTSSPPGLCP